MKPENFFHARFWQTVYLYVEYWFSVTLKLCEGFRQLEGDYGHPLFFVSPRPQRVWYNGHFRLVKHRITI